MSSASACHGFGWNRRQQPLDASEPAPQIEKGSASIALRTASRRNCTTDTGRPRIEITTADCLRRAISQPCAVRSQPNASALATHNPDAPALGLAFANLWRRSSAIGLPEACSASSSR